MTAAAAPPRLARWLPFLAWARGYSRGDAAADGFAAVVVTIMLVPQSLAYAMLAGLPPQVGLYASILPLVAYAIFGTSRTLAVGPVAVISLMTAAAVGAVAERGTEAYLQAAVTLALLSGLVLLVMAVLRLGFLANLLSHPVISGFISAAGVLIAAGQIEHLLGVSTGGDTLPGIFAALVGSLGGTNPLTLAIGVAATGFLFWARTRLRPLLQRAGMGPRAAALLGRAAPLAAVLLAILAVWFFALDARGVRIVGEIPAGLPPFALPAFDPTLWFDLLPAAALISLVGFVESVSVAQTLAAKRRQRIGANQELVGLGTANLAAAVSGGYPVTGGFARSAVNFDAGAATPLAGALTALGILAAALFLAPLLGLLPKAVLAATIIVAVLSLVDLRAIRRTFAYSKADFAAMATTIAVVLLVGIEPGILAGVLVSLALFVWRSATPHIAVVGRVPGSEHYRNVLRHAVLTSPEVLSLRVDESLWFANARALEDRVIEEVALRPGLRHVVLMCPAVNAIDASALESLEMIAGRLRAAGLGFHLSEVKGPVMDALRRSDFFAHFDGQVFVSQFGAMRALGGENGAAARPGGPEGLPPQAG